MAKYRHELPQLGNSLFLTDGGIETTLVFHHGLELPDFAAFDLLKDEAGCEVIRDYFRPYVNTAREHDAGFILESVTWRASPDWGERLGYSRKALASANHKAIDVLAEIRDEFETKKSKMVISGCVGPRGDGYSPTSHMTAAEAEDYHSTQIGTFSETAADMVTAITMTYAEEAIGVTRAAAGAGMPAVIAFTTETDGRLPSGQNLKDAIEEVDSATGGTPVYYMINCAHPTHFENTLAAGEAWTRRIKGLRANASTKSHAELDEAEELDEGNPVELGGQYRDLVRLHQHINVLGGCCGTDHRHVEAICKSCLM